MVTAPNLDLPDNPEINPDSSDQPSQSPSTHKISPEVQEKINEYKQQQVENIKGRLAGAERKLAPKPEEAAKQKGQQILKQEGRAAASQRLRVAAQATGRAVQAATTAIGEFIAANPITWAVIGIILLIVLIIATIFFVSSLGGGGGNGPPIYPSTAAQRQEVTTLAALSGNQIANNQLLAKVVNEEKARLNNAKASIAKVYASDSSKAASATNDLTAIITAMEAVQKEPLITKRQALIQTVNDQIQAFMKKYPEILGYGAGNGGYLGVPGVREAASGDCGAASVLMVTLYYDPAYTDAGILDKAAHRSTQGGSVCVSTEYLNGHTPYQDWTRATKQTGSLTSIKRSLLGGDPVIIYGAKGVIYNNSKHIFVIVGYDPSDDSFYVNNPFPPSQNSTGGVQVHTKTPNGHKMTSANLQSHLGSSAPDPEGFGHNYIFMIRSKYLQ